MNVKARPRILMVAASAALAALAAGGASLVTAATAAPAPSHRVAHYTLDPETGIATFDGYIDGPGAAISGPHNPPGGTDFVLRPSQIPLAAYGFSGVGTKTGSWTNRSGLWTGNWTGYVKLHVPGGSTQQSPHFGPQTEVGFVKVATVTQVTITS